MHIGIICCTVARVKGGSQRLAVNVANAMAARNHRVSLFCAPGPTGGAVYPLDARVSLCFLQGLVTQEGAQANRRIFTEAHLDVCVAMHTYTEQLLCAIPCLGTGIPYILSELSCPANVEEVWNRAGRLAAMSAADAIHLLLPKYAESLPDFLRARVCCIPLPAPDRPSLAAQPGKACNGLKVLISLGRLATVKQIPLLIRAFQRIGPDFPDWRLEIWGTGLNSTATEALRALIQRYPNIFLCGAADNVMHVFSRSNLFCIPSRQEGFPTTVLEAMRCGLPVVGFADCPGVNSIVKHRVNGLLAPQMTVESLAQTLSTLMANDALRTTMGEAASHLPEEVRPENVYDQWETLFSRVAGLKGHTCMDKFAKEPFASRVTLSAAARRERIFRNFGEPMPGSWPYYKIRLGTLIQRLIHWKWFKKQFGSCKKFFVLTKKYSHHSPMPLASLRNWSDVLVGYRQACLECPQVATEIIKLSPDKFPGVDAERERGLPGNPSYQKNGYCHTMLARYFLAAVSFGRGARVLELGAGLGWGAYILAHYAKDVCCIEQDAKSVIACRKLWTKTNLQWQTGNIPGILSNYADETFDLVTCMEVIEHLPQGAGALLFAEVARLLRPGGHLVISSAFPDSRQKAEEMRVTNAHHVHILTDKEIRTLGARYFAETTLIDGRCFIGRK